MKFTQFFKSCKRVVFVALPPLFVTAMSSSQINAQSDVNFAATEFERQATNVATTIDAEILEGSHWQLDATETERAESLHRHFRQYISDRQISPLEILGIHARSDAERNVYARRWAELMIRDAERVLAFQRAYDRAVRELLADQPLIDLVRLAPQASPLPDLAEEDRLAVFVEFDCDVCDQVLRSVFKSASQVSGIDVYVVAPDMGDRSRLHSWAQRQGIPPHLVSSKRITLNYDDGLLARVHPRVQDVPVVMRRRGSHMVALDPWSLALRE